MKIVVSLVLWFVFLAPSYSRAEVYGLYKIEKIPGALYFTPSASSPEYAVFGYVSKVVPSEGEIRREKQRITSVIDRSVKEGYGSWSEMYGQLGSTGDEASRSASEKAPPWLKILFPPSLVKESVPLLLKGAMLYVKAHPEAAREPIGNVGETGIVIVDGWGGVTKVPLGINAPVVSMDVSGDGRLVAVLTDMSFEDKKGRLHLLGEISLVDLHSKKRMYSWIFANLGKSVTFVPSAHMLAFGCYVNSEKLSEREVRFIDLKDKKVTKHHYRFTDPGSGLIFGKKVNHPGFVVPKNQPVIALYTKGAYEIRSISTGNLLLKVKSGGRFVSFGNKHPWIFTDLGELWDYKTGKLLSRIVPRLQGRLLPLNEGKFTADDAHVVYLEGNFLTIFDTRNGKLVVSTGSMKDRGGLFFLSSSKHYLFAFVSEKGLVSYKNKYLRRQRMCLGVLGLSDLKIKQKICLAGSTVLDAALAGNTLVVSDFDSLRIYALAEASGSTTQSPGVNGESVLLKVERNPARFSGKLVEIDGWAWGWMAKPPEALKGKKIPFAKGNYGSRNDGTFTDGNLRVLYPVSPSFSGKFHIKAKVKITPGGWQLVPVK